MIKWIGLDDLCISHFILYQKVKYLKYFIINKDNYIYISNIAENIALTRPII